MSDLFTRLAQRARGGYGPAMAPEPQPAVVWDDEAPSDELVAPPEPPIVQEQPVPEGVQPVALAAPSTQQPPLHPEVATPAPAPLVAVPSVVPALPPRAGDGGRADAPALRPAPTARHDHTTVEKIERVRWGEPREASALLHAPRVEQSPLLLLPPAPPPPVPSTQSRREPAPGSEPRTVEVTIGRVEIRVRPPLPTRTAHVPREPAAPAPALSLEEYLRRREVSP